MFYLRVLTPFLAVALFCVTAFGATLHLDSLDIPGFADTSAFGINDLGDIVGSVRNGGAPQGFHQSAVGVITTFSVAASSTSPAGINNSRT